MGHHADDQQSAYVLIFHLRDTPQTFFAATGSVQRCDGQRTSGKLFYLTIPVNDPDTDIVHFRMLRRELVEQKQILENTFENWRKDFEQIDDVLIMGVKI